MVLYARVPNPLQYNFLTPTCLCSKISNCFMAKEQQLIDRQSQERLRLKQRSKLTYLKPSCCVVISILHATDADATDLQAMF